MVQQLLKRLQTISRNQTKFERSNNLFKIIPATKKTEVPQGSVLAPIIFSHFTYDHPSTERYSNTIMYADNTGLLSSSKTAKDLEIKSYIYTSLQNIVTKTILRLLKPKRHILSQVTKVKQQQGYSIKVIYLNQVIYLKKHI